jgi:molybdate-binding protein
MEHDGVYQKGEIRSTSRFNPEKTLILASCDPAAALLATEVHRLTGLRLIVLHRTSREALALIGQGFIHAAGIHLATNQKPRGNTDAVQECLGSGYRLLRVARWQEGLALVPGSGLRSIPAVLQAKLRWIGRQPGSAARQCLDDLLDRYPPPRRVAQDHRDVANAIRAGWADAGVCLKLVCEEAGLGFIPLREEIYELCFAGNSEKHLQIQALTKVVRSASYRKLLEDLPGYDPAECGEMQ